MEKVLLVTLWDYGNFGNRLQAIALKKSIEDCGYNVDCVPNMYKRSYDKKTNIKRIIVETLAYFNVKRFKSVKLMKIRKKTIKSSSDKILHDLTSVVHDYSFIDNFDLSEYVAAVSGSDQVWHRWTDVPTELDFFYLSFMPSNKRISYAASFGFESFPLKDYETHKKLINEMAYISCREKSGCELVNEVSDKNAELVLDPTLCVDVEYWKGIAEQPNYAVPKKYIFCMMLGSSEQYKPVIYKYANDNSLEILDIRDQNSEEIWTTTIGGFIWLIQHAEMVCTDSFHCSVFSILFEKSFTVFRRQQKGFEHMYDRIQTLLELTGLQQCEYNGKYINDFIPDFNSVKYKLQPMISSSKKWLKDTLDLVAKKE